MRGPLPGDTAQEPSSRQPIGRGRPVRRIDSTGEAKPSNQPSIVLAPARPAVVVALSLLSAQMLTLTPARAVAQSPIPLRPPLYSALITGTVGGAFAYKLDHNSVLPTPVRTGVVPGPRGSSFSVTASYTGGLSPSVRITGVGNPPFAGGIGALGRAEAATSYVMRANMASGFPPSITSLPVPINVTGSMTASVFPSNPGNPQGGGFASALTEIRAPGVSILEGPPQADHLRGATQATRFSRTFSVTPGAIVSVYLFVRGLGTGWEFDAFADPRFEVDPLASFDFNGETIHFADVVTLEYSPGLLVPEPGSGLLAVSALVGLLCVGRRRPRIEHDCPVR